MSRKLTTILLATALAGLCLAASAGAIGSFGIYANDMSTAEKKAQIRATTGRNCKRGGSAEALRVEIGKRTKECVFRTPVIGRDVEIIVTERLLSGTPRALRPRVYLSVSLRRQKGMGAYQLLVYPLQRKYQLRKIVPGEDIRYLAVGKQISAIKGINEANKIRLRAFNLINTRDKDDCRLLVYVNGKRLAVITDKRSGGLQGRETGFSAGARRGANGAIASFDNVKVRVPRPTF